MKNANSLLRRVLALALACMLLAGCSSKQQPGSSEAASSGDSHSSSTESSAPDSSGGCLRPGQLQRRQFLPVKQLFR